MHAFCEIINVKFNNMVMICDPSAQNHKSPDIKWQKIAFYLKM